MPPEFGRIQLTPGKLGDATPNGDVQNKGGRWEDLMSGHTVVQSRGDSALKADVANGHGAAAQKLRRVVKREAISTLLFEGRQRPWVHEDAARASKRRSLIDDNPASG